MGLPSSPIARRGLGKWAKTSSYGSNARSRPLGITAAERPRSPITLSGDSGIPLKTLKSGAISQSDADIHAADPIHKVASHETTSYTRLLTMEPDTRYRQAWSKLDRLAFALAKVDLATWEHARIKDRFSNFKDDEFGESCDAIQYFTTRLRESLAHLGMNQHTMERVIVMCQSQELQQGMRVPVEHKYISSFEDRQALCDLGIAWKESKASRW